MKNIFAIATLLFFTLMTNSFANMIMSSPPPPLFKALKEKKSYNEIKAMLDSGADIYRNYGYMSILMEAGRLNVSNNIMELLIYEAAEAELVDETNQTALTFLLDNLRYDKDVDIKNVKSLIRAGVNVNAVSGGDEVTAYRIAKACGREDIVELLIKSGADINKGKELLECKAKYWVLPQ